MSVRENIMGWLCRLIDRFESRCMELVTSSKTGRMDLTKLGSATAYFAATLCFLWMHCWLFLLADPVKFQMAYPHLMWFWVIYLGTVGGHHLLNKNLDLKSVGTTAPPPRQEESAP